ncbi:hypothetical protein WJX75_008129 [Coccomyxa subellipsoidea]|uniref:Uncharacterized protein n=1 Tax=Coccomyxa subellipsoidea TaxID=248742 RepID=A0ABR2YWP1_9CHLO
MAGRARKPFHAIGAEAYMSDESTSSEQGLHFNDVQPRQGSKEAGFQELAWVAQKYGAANLRRRNGQDLVPVGPASELPMRVAAQQLAALAGMSQKVQEAIVNSQAVFMRQVQLKERAFATRFHRIAAQGLLRRTFTAWDGLCETRWWKTQLNMRDRQIALLEAEMKRMEGRSAPSGTTIPPTSIASEGPSVVASIL